MITVYGADWCEDTRRARRHMRRLGVPHRYVNIDEDPDALQVAKALNDGKRRTPTIDLGVGERALVEPDNDAVRRALARVSEARARAAADWHDATPDEMTVPTTIADEHATNPFLRAGSIEELGRRRAAKDSF